MYQINEFIDFIENAAIATEGVDLFIYSAPAEIDECVLLKPSNDPPIIDPERPLYYKGKFQTIVRTNKFEDGLDKCKDLQSALTLFNETTATIKIKECRPLHEARVYRRGDSGAIEMSITYLATYTMK